MYQRSVRVYLGRMLHRRDLIDDIAQDVFVTAYQRIAQFRGDGPLGHWLLGIARMRLQNHFRDDRRRRLREGSAADDVLVLLGEASIDHGWISCERHDRETAALEECLKKLPAFQSDLVRQHYREGRTAAEIAARYGLSFCEVAPADPASESYRSEASERSSRFGGRWARRQRSLSRTRGRSGPLPFPKTRANAGAWAAANCASYST